MGQYGRPPLATAGFLVKISLWHLNVIRCFVVMMTGNIYVQLVAVVFSGNPV